MNLQSMIMSWLRKLPVVVGLLCFAGGRLVRRTAARLSANARPLEPVWVRAHHHRGRGGRWSCGFYRHPLLAQAPGGEGARGRRSRPSEREAAATARCLPSRMTEALETLKRSSGKQTFLYELPWYIIIGPPGAGKTTALVNSGLKFPLAGQDGARIDRRRRRHALLRFLVHRGRRADRHGRPLHHAGFRCRDRPEELAVVPVAAQARTAPSSRSTASSWPSASRTC